MTEEIKKIARTFAEETSYGDALDPHIDFAESFAIEVLQWLSRDYAIVEKSRVEEHWHHYDDVAFEAGLKQDERRYDWNEGARYALTNLFGKSFFLRRRNESEQELADQA